MKSIAKMVLSSALILGSFSIFNQADAANYPGIQGQAAAVYDVTAGKTLYQKNANATYDLASSSKLMTAYLVMEKIRSGHSWNEKIRITDAGMIRMSNDASWGKLHFRYGDTITIKEAYELMLLPSANEAAEILGRWATGSDSAYVQKANQTAKKWGMNSAVFVNASGVDNSESYRFGFQVKNTYGNNRMSANDAEKMASNILNTHSEIINTTKKTYTTYKGVYYVSHVRNTFGGAYTSDINSSIRVDGLKNGFTDGAQNTYITTAYKNNHRLIAVILKSGNMWDRDTVARDANRLLVSGFNGIQEQYANNTNGSSIKVGDLVQIKNNAWAL